MGSSNERLAKETLAQKGLWPLTLGKWYEIDANYIKYIKYRGYTKDENFEVAFLNIQENISIVYSSTNLQFSRYLTKNIKIPLDYIIREVNVGEIQHYIPNNEIQFIDGEWYQFEWTPKPGMNYNKAAGKCDFKGCISNRFAFTEVKKEGKDIEKRSSVWIIDNALKITPVKVLTFADLKTTSCLNNGAYGINLVDHEQQKQAVRDYLLKDSYNLAYNFYVNKDPSFILTVDPYYEPEDIKLITKKKSKLFEASDMINVNEKLITKK